MTDNYHTIVSFLSSSELNRCKKNGLFIWEPNQWFEVIKYPWLTRKLRRKIGHLWTLNILPELPRKYVIGIGDEPANGLYKELSAILARKMLNSEDYYILHGELKNE